jgi:hypothetical protein
MTLSETLEDRLLTRLEERLAGPLLDKLVERMEARLLGSATVTPAPAPKPKPAKPEGKIAIEGDMPAGVGRPRKATPKDNDLRKCPHCGETKPVLAGFGFTTVQMVDGPVKKAYSWCKSCRAIRNKG